MFPWKTLPSMLMAAGQCLTNWPFNARGPSTESVKKDAFSGLEVAEQEAIRQALKDETMATQSKHLRHLLFPVRRSKASSL